MITCAVVHAEPVLGVDYLAGKRYETAMIQAHPEQWAGGIFLRTFGNARGTLERMAASGKFSSILVHTEPFDPSHRYNIEERRDRVLIDFEFLQEIAEKYPLTKIYGSPFCEHDHPREKIEPFLLDLRVRFPNVEPVNSILRGAVVPGIITEIHLENSKPRAPPPGDYMVSFDGFGGKGTGDFPDANICSILKRYSDSKQIRLWNFRFNGKFGHLDKAPVSDRRHFPDTRYITAHTRMMKQREGSISWPKTALYKPMADDHGTGGKDNKLVVIIRSDKRHIYVRDSRGRRVDILRRVRPDHKTAPKGARYYSSKYAYQIADIAKRRTGSALVKVENLPLTDGYLRSGLFK